MYLSGASYKIMLGYAPRHPLDISLYWYALSFEDYHQFWELIC